MVHRAVPAATLVLLSALLVGGAFLASDGFFTIDELIYWLGADALATTGTFAVENGYERFGSDDLRLWFLIDGPTGLVPQYPPGSAWIGAPFVAALGPRGLILMNALAGITVLALTYRSAVVLYADRLAGVIAMGILVFATFFLEYAWGMWPHVLSTAFALAAFLSAWTAILPETERPFPWAFLSGLMIAAGMLVRTDVILLLPGILALVILFARAPVRVLSGGVLGVLPGLAAAAWTNLQKFGTPNPLSYGSSGGGTDPTGHLAAAATILIVFLILGTIRLRNEGRTSLALPLGIAIASIAAVLVVPELRAVAEAYGRGAWALLGDMTWIRDERSGVRPNAEGGLAFWGAAKKALGQSLPWIGVLAVALGRDWLRVERRSHAVILITAFFWTLPFALREWHGGFSFNMRYFLPIVPLLAVMAAMSWRRLQERTAVGPLVPVLGIAAGVVTVQVVMSVSPAEEFASHQILATWVLLVALSMGALAAIVLARPVQIAAQATLAFALGVAAVHGAIHDVISAQKTRDGVATSNELLAETEGPAMFYGGAKEYAFAFSRQDTIVGLQDRLTNEVDAQLIGQVLDDGYRVFMSHATATRFLIADDGFAATGLSLPMNNNEALEIVRAGARVPEGSGREANEEARLAPDLLTGPFVR
ncbi:MAG: hypothetical protein AAFR35_03175 [Pseudomonadota bacterium]